MGTYDEFVRREEERMRFAFGQNNNLRMERMMKKILAIILFTVICFAYEAKAHTVARPAAFISLSSSNKWFINVYEPGNLTFVTNDAPLSPLFISRSIMNFQDLKKSLESGYVETGPVNVEINTLDHSNSTEKLTHGHVSNAKWNALVKQIYSKLNSDEQKTFDEYVAKYPIMLEEKK